MPLPELKLASLICLCAIVYFHFFSPTSTYINYLPNEQDPTHPLTFPKSKQVSNSTSFFYNNNNNQVNWHKVHAHNQPLVFRKFKPTQSWKSVQHWNASLLATKWKTIRAQFVPSDSDLTVKMLSFVQPFGRVSELSWNAAWNEKTVSGLEFFSQTQQTTTPLMYLFAPVEKLPRHFHSDFGRLELLGDDNSGIDSAGFWSGPPGVASPLHYDAAHNAYLQIFGYKRFLLFPTHVSDTLYCHSRLHPSTRSSFINVRKVARHRFPLFEQALNNSNALHSLHPLEVVLGPGDVLYIPPYYWHRASVIGTEMSMSLAVYSTSKIMEKYDILKSYPIPIDKKWLWSRRVAGLKIYICALARLFDTSITCTSWISNLLTSRYTSMHLDPLKQNIVNANKLKNWSYKNKRIFLWKTNNNVVVPKHVEEQLMKHALNLKSRLQLRDGKIEKEQMVSKDIWKIELKSLAEDIVNFVLGSGFVECFFYWMNEELSWKE